MTAKISESSPIEQHDYSEEHSTISAANTFRAEATQLFGAASKTDTQKNQDTQNSNASDRQAGSTESKIPAVELYDSKTAPSKLSHHRASNTEDAMPRSHGDKNAINTSGPHPHREPNDANSAKPHTEPNDANSAKPHREPNDAHSAKPHREPNDAHSAKPHREPNDAHSVKPHREPNDAHSAKPHREPNDAQNHAPLPARHDKDAAALQYPHWEKTSDGGISYKIPAMDLSLAQGSPNIIGEHKDILSAGKEQIVFSGGNVNAPNEFSLAIGDKVNLHRDNSGTFTADVKTTHGLDSKTMKDGDKLSISDSKSGEKFSATVSGGKLRIDLLDGSSVVAGEQGFEQAISKPIIIDAAPGQKRDVYDLRDLPPLPKSLEK